MILTGLTRYRDAGLLLLRVGLGIAFCFHGWPKLSGGQATWEHVGGMAGLPMPMVFGLLAALTEFVGGIFLILGLLFRPVCILMAVNLLVALVLVHLRNHDAFLAYSHALEDAIVFVALIFIGPGSYSVDRA